MTTTENSITKNMTPVEAANLLAKLEEGHQAAWRATRETREQGAERASRFHNATEVDGVFRDLMWETLGNGTRHPGESVAQFAARAQAEARRADTRDAGTQPAETKREPGRPGKNGGHTRNRGREMSRQNVPGTI